MTSGIAQLYWLLNLGYWDHDPTVSLPVVKDDTIECLPGSSSAFGCGHPTDDTLKTAEPYYRVETSNTQPRPCFLPSSTELSASCHPVSINQHSHSPTHAVSPYGHTLSSSSIVAIPEELSSFQSTSSNLKSSSLSNCDRCGEPFDDADTLCSHLVSFHNISKPFHCGRKTCRPHSELKSLRRHLANFHFDAVYVCCCGYASRKDKHCGHLRKKTCEGRSYLCICGHPSHDKRVHILHINMCGRRKRGRPKKQNKYD